METRYASRILSAAASTNATLASDRAATLGKVIGYNASAATLYLKLYNKASSPTVGTDTPVLTIALPPSSAFVFDLEHNFSVGLGYGLATGSADNSTGALTAGDVLGLNVMWA